MHNKNYVSKTIPIEDLTVYDIIRTAGTSTLMTRIKTIRQKSDGRGNTDEYIVRYAIEDATKPYISGQSFYPGDKVKILIKLKDILEAL